MFGIFGKKSTKRKRPKAKPRRKGPGFLGRLFEKHRRGLLVVVAMSAAIFLLAAGSAYAFIRIETQADGLLLGRYDAPRFEFVDLPEDLTALAMMDLEEAITPFGVREWTDPTLPEDVGRALQEVPWLDSLSWVRRRPQARFEISADYRRPVALVQSGGDFVLVDREGVRLPGTYMYHPAWKLVQGVDTLAPAPGSNWDAADLRAGLAVVMQVRNEPFASQVSAVLVTNFDGRKDRRGAEIELATDRPGGRIAWGSPPGNEVEENSAAQKLRILRENFRRTGRIDAGYTVIDISTYPDRFTVPP